MSGWLMNAKHIPSSFGRDIECDDPTPSAQRQAGGPGAPSPSLILQDLSRLWSQGRSFLRRKSTSVAAW